MTNDHFDFSEFDYIKTPVEWKHNLLNTIKVMENTKKYRRSKFPVSIAACLCIFFLLSGSAAAVYHIRGGEFFKAFYRNFNQDASLDNYSNLEQLDEMSGKDHGIVFEDDDVKIELLGVVYSGKTIQIMLDATLKNMDTLDSGVETGTPWLNKYMFGDMEIRDGNTTLNGFAYRNIYHDQEESLSPNQIRLVLDSTFNDIIKQGTKYSICLDQFGFVDKNLKFQPAIDRTWSFDIVKNNDSDEIKSLTPKEEIRMKNHTFDLDDIALTPLSCYATFSYTSFSDTASEQYDEFIDLMHSIQIKMKDGYVLKRDSDYEIQHEAFDAEPSDHSQFTNQITILFNKPIELNNVSEIIINDHHYTMK